MPKSKNNSDNDNDKLNHHKLTPARKQKTPFEGRLRDPGWRPDEVTEKAGGSAAKPEAVYVQEFLGGSTNAAGSYRIPFQPPISSAGGANWILGGALNPKPGDTFDEWLLALSGNARNYNASLYRLRRLHLIAEGNARNMDPLPGDSPHLPTAAELPGIVKKAEKEWRRSAAALRKVIDRFKADALVDMVQVNGYIVSIRAVAEIFLRDKNKLMQPAGSSSSHWSLSSAFSSSSSAAPAKR